MKFYLDFEATDNNYITSIGCVSETGETFRSLVKLPPGEVISPFVMELTGLGADLLEREGQSAQAAFLALFEFIVKVGGDGNKPEYFCYGDMDRRFLRETAKTVEQNILAWTFLDSLTRHLVDASFTVRRHFGMSSSLGLKRVYALIDKDAVQRHDALEDALMLKAIMEQLEQLPEDAFDGVEGLQKMGPNALPKEPSNDVMSNETVSEKVPPQETAKVKKTKAPDARRRVPDFFCRWSGAARNKYLVDTFATAEQYVIRAHSALHEKYFDGLDTAVLWLMKYTHGARPSNQKMYLRFERKLKNALETSKPYYGLLWEYGTEDFEKISAENDAR